MDIRRKPIKYFKILIGIISDTIICVECSKLSNDATDDLPWKVTGKGKLVERENQEKECS